MPGNPPPQPTTTPKTTTPRISVTPPTKKTSSTSKHTPPPEPSSTKKTSSTSKYTPSPENPPTKVCIHRLTLHLRWLTYVRPQSLRRNHRRRRKRKRLDRAAQDVQFRFTTNAEATGTESHGPAALNVWKVLHAYGETVRSKILQLVLRQGSI